MKILKVLGIIAIHATLFGLLLIFYVFPVIAYQFVRDRLRPPPERLATARTRYDDFCD